MPFPFVQRVSGRRYNKLLANVVRDIPGGMKRYNEINGKSKLSSSNEKNGMQALGRNRKKEIENRQLDSSPWI